MGLRKLKRNIAKTQMKNAGISQPNKARYKTIDGKGNPVTCHTSSFFSTHWRDKVENKEGKNAND